MPLSGWVGGGGGIKGPRSNNMPRAQHYNYRLCCLLHTEHNADFPRDFVTKVLQVHIEIIVICKRMSIFLTISRTNH